MQREGKSPPATTTMARTKEANPSQGTFGEGHEDSILMMYFGPRPSSLVDVVVLLCQVSQPSWRSREGAIDPTTGAAFLPPEGLPLSFEAEQTEPPQDGVWCGLRITTQ